MRELHDEMRKFLLNYLRVVKDIINHGPGVVVNYVMTHNSRVEYRSAGFIESSNADLGLACIFDMIIQ